MPFTPTCRAATPPCAIRRGFISASPCPCVSHASPGETIAAVAGSARPDGGGDLGMMRAQWRAEEERWWEHLAAADAPKIIARLPFVERPDHPAGMPVFIISNPLAEAAARDVALFAGDGAAQAPDDGLFARRAANALARARDGRWRLAAGVGARRSGAPKSSRRPRACPAGRVAWIGSHAERFDLARIRLNKAARASPAAGSAREKPGPWPASAAGRSNRPWRRSSVRACAACRAARRVWRSPGPPRRERRDARATARRLWRSTFSRPAGRCASSSASAPSILRLSVARLPLKLRRW